MLNNKSKEEKDLEDGTKKHVLFLELVRAAADIPGMRHPHLYAMRELSYDPLTESEIDLIEEGSAVDTIMSASDIALYHISEAMKSIPEKQQHQILDAIEATLLFSSYLHTFPTETTAGLANELAAKSVKTAIKNRASKAGKASRKPYIEEKRRALTRYQELIQLPNFKNAFRSVVARKIASEPGFTSTPRTIGGWIKEFQSTSK